MRRKTVQYITTDISTSLTRTPSSRRRLAFYRNAIDKTITSATSFQMKVSHQHLFDFVRSSLWPILTICSCDVFMYVCRKNNAKSKQLYKTSRSMKHTDNLLTDHSLITSPWWKWYGLWTVKCQTGEHQSSCIFLCLFKCYFIRDNYTIDTVIIAATFSN